MNPEVVDLIAIMVLAPFILVGALAGGIVLINCALHLWKKNSCTFLKWPYPKINEGGPHGESKKEACKKRQRD